MATDPKVTILVTPSKTDKPTLPRRGQVAQKLGSSLCKFGMEIAGISAGSEPQVSAHARTPKFKLRLAWRTGAAIAIGFVLSAANAAPPVRQAPFSQTKLEALAKLQTLAANETKALLELDQQIKRRIVETRELKLAHEDSALTARDRHKLNSFGATVEAILHERDERQARRSVYEQILFQVDSKWTGGTLREFLQGQMLEAAITDASESGSSQSTRKLWKLYAHLSVALREAADPREDPIDFIAGYIVYSSALNPKSPALFLEDRSYSNGSENSAARRMTLEKAGDEADKRLREIGILPPLPKRKRAPRVAEISERADIILKSPPPAPEPGPEIPPEVQPETQPETAPVASPETDQAQSTQNK